MTENEQHRRRSLRLAVKAGLGGETDARGEGEEEDGGESLQAENGDGYSAALWFTALVFGICLALSFAILRPFGDQPLTLGQQALWSLDLIGVGAAVAYLVGLGYSGLKAHSD